MRRIATIILAGALFASSAAYAGDTARQPGRPAGVKQANIFSGTPLYVTLGLVAVGLAIGIATSQGKDKVPVSSSTGTAP
jgi:hypothetical protein